MGKTTKIKPPKLTSYSGSRKMSSKIGIHRKVTPIAQAEKDHFDTSENNSKTVKGLNFHESIKNQNLS